ncbi:hypothetical protein AB8T15_18170 [Klebsiella pneumoniae]|uniref:hypothetical protein n=1 Tax=Klebsiella pneumoniae TaxID=573 RepID=UPI0020CF1D49|nr:hypothetical protein [Klebsiella pneumoniae]MCQ0744167.1 hypothetical protein [Klebsiella pneumoniae]
MSETIIAEHTAVRINRTMLAGYLHQSLQQVCKLASGLKILRLPASDTTRRATILTEPVYAAARLRLAQQQPLAQNPLCDDVLRRFRHAPGLTADLPDLIDTMRSVTLPVWSRLRRDGHSDDVALRQTLLHILAWKSESSWLQDQVSHPGCRIRRKGFSGRAACWVKKGAAYSSPLMMKPPSGAPGSAG